MKTARQQRRATGEASTQSNGNTGIGCTGAKTTTKKLRARRRKTTGQSDISSIGKDWHSLPSCTAQTLTKQLPVKGTVLPETTNILPKLELEHGQTLQPFAKIKIQLFPIDEFTRRGLEKDGYNPHLELTLSDRKKISSVLKHLKNKWGSSSTAQGELMLFPYDILLENLAGCRRWTLEDTGTSAADVFAATGRPSIFRLRYGWLSNPESKTFCVPLQSSCNEDCSQDENIKKGCSMNVEIANGEKQPNKLVDQEYRPISISNMPDTVVGAPMPSDRAEEPKDNSGMGNGRTLSSLWADCLTNLSIGGLFSEASLHAAAKCGDLMPAQSDSRLQQIPLSSDSFDAAIAAHIYGHPQGPHQPAHGSHSSILDAEETCHAFPFQKLSSLGKEVPASSNSALDSFSRDANTQAGITQVHGFQEPKVGSPPKPNTQGVDNFASSFGMADINWSDSLGNLDLGLSSSRQLICGDSISLSGLFASSQDAFQNCSLFARDAKVCPK